MSDATPGYIAGLEAAERACMERSETRLAVCQVWPKGETHALCMSAALEAWSCATTIKSLREAAQRESGNG